MIGTISIECNAKNPNMPLWPLRAYVNSPSSLRIRNVPKKIGQWEITSVQVNVNYPDKTLKTAQCVLVGGVWVGTIEGSPASGTCTNGYTVIADGIDENGNPVNGYVLGRGDVEILKEDGTPIEDPTHFVTDDELDAAISSKAEISSVDAVAEDLVDLSNSLSGYYLKTETSSTVELDAKFETKADLSALNEVENSLSDYYTKTETSSAVEIQNALDGKQPTGDYALTSQLPTKVSQLSNDSGYLTEHQSLSDYYTKSETSSASEISTVFETKADISSIPTKTSQLSNDSDFITSRQVQPYNGITGYAKNSYGSLFLFGRNSTFLPNENKYVAMDFNNGDKMLQVERTYLSWFLSQFETTTFDPPLELKYRYVETYTWRVGARTFRQYISSNCWVQHSGTKCYYIKADEDGNALPVFYVMSVEHPITFDEYELSIETMDGETGNINCTRESTNPVIVSQRYVAYEDDVSAVFSVKADLSAVESVSTDIADLSASLSDYYTKSETSSTSEISTALALKQDKLSDVQVSAINSVVDERKTVVKYDDNSIVAYDIDGTLLQNALDISGKNIIEVKIGNAVTAIGAHCFDSYKQLVNVYIPNSVTTIDRYAFIECDNLTGLLIPESVTTIGDYAFYSCESLTSELIIPDSVTSIGIEAFVTTHCPKFVIGSGVTNIGAHAFLGNGGRIKEMTFKGKTLAEVQSMTNYPWSISDTSIIKTWNTASQEWVLEQLSALEARIAALENN